ncbi:Y-family DNA polymerase [Lachnoclostridium sp. An131]|uniref:Y-family DNA polymerase n=1 Tax=Lachnoclostridium sp. An131 TaxID=1965555 RepID=UPI001FA900BD|nr:DNA polymerase IV [Lachnoclostridium sp. An131]
MENLSVPFVMKKKRFVFHVDVNSAFLSWSAVYRTCILGESEDLRRAPSIVGGDQEKRHGIVLAKSIPAKQFGIQTGEPLVSARRKCPDLIVIPPDYGLYVRASRALMKLLRRYSDQVIPYSIDEAWVIFDGFESLYGREQMVSLAYQMKQEIRDWLSFTVNIGVSTKLLLSKMAGEFSKPDRVHTLFEEEMDRKMRPLPVSELFMAGPALSGRLRSLGIRTIGELADADPEFIRTHLKRPGEVLQGYARGRELEPYIFTHEENKGYGNSMTAPADITEELYQAACRSFLELWDGRTPVRQIGVHASKTEKSRERQYPLFGRERQERLERLDRAVDDIRRRYGEDSVMRAAFLKSRVPHMGGGLDRERRTGVTAGIDVEKEGQGVSDVRQILCR